MSEQKIAVVILETEKNNKGEYIPCLVKDGETGYHRTDWSWGSDKELAEKTAKEYNKRLGLTPEEVMEITLRSMRKVATVVIEIHDGAVSNVYSDSPIDTIIIDTDIEDEDEETYPFEAQVSQERIDVAKHNLSI